MTDKKRRRRNFWVYFNAGVRYNPRHELVNDHTQRADGRRVGAIAP